MSEHIVDVLVAGGGPAGSTVALRLARAGGRVALLERSGYDRLRVGETLPPRVTSLLTELQLMDAFLGLEPKRSYEVASAWGDHDVTARSCIFNPHGAGWHVDRVRFDATLAAAAEGAGAMVRRRAQAVSARRVDHELVDVTVAAHDGQDVVRARHVVDASGRSARLARALGGRVRRLDDLVAVSVLCDLPPDVEAGDTFVEAVADGWWYVSPLPGRRRMVSMFTDRSIARRRRLADPSGWWEALHRSVHAVGLARQGAPSSRPTVASATSHVLAPAAGDAWTTVGDAALAVDPLSSSGVASALESARRAFEVITAVPEARAAARHDYATWVTNAAARHVVDRAYYYGLEHRFADEPFWRARAGRLAFPLDNSAAVKVHAHDRVGLDRVVRFEAAVEPPNIERLAERRIDQPVR